MNRSFRKVETEAVVVLNKKLSETFFEISLEIPLKCLSSFIPGMFCMLSVPSKLLRRPFCIYKLNKNILSILYKVTGEGTKYLSSLKKGENLSLFYPLGNGFPVDEFEGKTLYLCAGGTGIASILPLYNFKDKDCILTAGFKNNSDLLKFLKNKKNVFISTDDGSTEFKGLVTDLLINLLKKERPSVDKTLICACGPLEMLKDLVKKVKPFGFKVFVSLEERMACGTGLCMGCAVSTVDGYRLVCKDGPVFDSKDIDWTKFR